MEERFKNINLKENVINNLKFEDSLKNDLNFQSNVFLNKNEKDLVLKQISDKINNIKMIFNSRIDGTDINKLKNAYLNKSNLLFAIKTIKGRRFGAFSKETFLKEKFNKSDSKAFLFSLDNMKIFKSTNNTYTIWNRDCDSIQFGGSTDLRIFYNFTSNQNYTSERKGKHADYNFENEPINILNGEKYFSVDIFEIFQIYF